MSHEQRKSEQRREQRRRDQRWWAGKLGARPARPNTASPATPATLFQQPRRRRRRTPPVLVRAAQAPQAAFTHLSPGKGTLSAPRCCCAASGTSLSCLGWPAGCLSTVLPTLAVTVALHMSETPSFCWPGAVPRSNSWGTRLFHELAALQLAFSCARKLALP
ncbi:hypothetical protein BKA66DRAFT_447185 [Pyrenochaeta sp. MPI-SDFR-AT-0127]|nr:hypothetical protein BKA66DRAFT_447185 [Pyrenochaeta sp. MPI-SDFR-AT-0127]